MELKPSKTRIAHTLYRDGSEDGKAGFNFLRYYIQQFSAGKYISRRPDCLTQVPESIDISWKERKGRAFMGS